MMTPAFSVVMPLYNKRVHVEAAIASALAQTLPPAEIIVIDDNSTDGGRALVAAIDHPLVRLIERETPGPGGYLARNLGIERAGGDWIAFLDADDIWHPDHLAELACVITASPGVGAAATRFDHVFDTHRQPQRIAAALAGGAVLDFAGFLRAWLEVRECPLWTGAIAFRRDVLIDAGLFPASGAVRGGDKDLWLRAMCRTQLAYSPAITAEFNRDSTNKVSKSTGTLAPPCLVATARAMLADADPGERRLLRRLINQEIAHYARYAMKAAGRTRIRAADVALPEGLGTLLLLLAARWVPGPVRRTGHRLLRRNRAQAQALAAN